MFRIRITRQPAGTQLAIKELPDAVEPRVVAVWGNAQNMLDWMLARAREHARNEQVRLAKEAQVPAVIAAGDAEEAAILADWPVA